MSTPVPLAWHRLPAARLGLVARSSSPLRASEVIHQSPEVTALLDGPIFGDGNRILYLYLDRAAGVDVPGSSSYAARGATLSVVGGRASTARGRTVADGASVAVQVPFTMVENGRNVWPAGHETSAVWRAGLGLLEPSGDLVFSVGHGGIPSWTAAAIAADYGGDRLAWLGYTDGGHSTILWERDGRRIGFPGENPLLPGFLVERVGSPSPIPVSSSSSGRAVQRAADPGGWGGYIAAAAILAGTAVAGTLAHRRRGRR